MTTVTCAVCGTGFSARSDAVYCSSACRQKAHRARTARRIADLRAHVVHGFGRELATPTAAGKSLQRAAASSIQRAREQVERSRELCRISTEHLQKAAAIQQQFGKHQVADTATKPTSRPDEFPAAPRTISTKAVQWPMN